MEKYLRSLCDEAFRVSALALISQQRDNETKSITTVIRIAMFIPPDSNIDTTTVQKM